MSRQDVGERTASLNPLLLSLLKRFSNLSLKIFEIVFGFQASRRHFIPEYKRYYRRGVWERRPKR